MCGLAMDIPDLVVMTTGEPMYADWASIPGAKTSRAMTHLEEASTFPAAMAPMVMACGLETGLVVTAGTWALEAK